MHVALFLFSGNRIGKKSCRINTISFWREKAGSIAKNRNIDEVKAMSYSCSESQPRTDMAPLGFWPSPLAPASPCNFLLAKAIPEPGERLPRSCRPAMGQRVPNSQRLFFFQALHVTQLMSFLESDQGIISFREKQNKTKTLL